MSDTYTAPAHGWTCFHCGETFTEFGRARDHFGHDPLADPACRIKIGEERGLLMTLRRAELARDSFRQQRDRADEEAEVASQERGAFLRLVRGATSAHDVRCHIDSLEGRALAAEAIVRTIEATHPLLVEDAREAVCRVAPSAGKPCTACTTQDVCQERGVCFGSAI